MSTALSLTRPQKAAAMLVAMGKPSASRLLKFFKQEELRALIDAAKMLRTIPQSELEKIVAEFEAEFTEGAGLLDSADKMETMLNESLSREEMDALMGVEKAAVATDAPPPVWPAVEKLEPAQARRVPRQRTSADGGVGAVEAGAAGRRQCALDARESRRAARSSSAC